MNTEITHDGAVDFNECSWLVGKCKCGLCLICGFPKHMAVHGPALGESAGSKAYDHEFVSELTFTP